MVEPKLSRLIAPRRVLSQPRSASTWRQLGVRALPAKEEIPMTDNLLDDDLLAALADVHDVLADEDQPEADFYPAADRFLRVLHAQLVDRGLVHGELDEWDPRPALLDVEGRLADADLAAACKTVRDSLDAAAGEMAKLN